ncbi:MAG: tetratricopeptide repeat protein [Pseudomonadota bacterium]
MPLCTLALLLAAALHAEEPALAHVELMVPVLAVQKVKLPDPETGKLKKQPVALLEGGRDRGLLATGRGTAYRQDPAVGLVELGPVEVLAVEDSEAVVRFLGEGRLSEGDLIELPAAVPEVLLGTLCWTLLSERISFTDEDELPLCDERAMVAEPAMDHDALAFLHGAEVVAQYAWYAHDDDDPAPLAEGRYAGKTLEEAMAGATAEDVRDFLLFVASFPGRYIGTTWRLTETWATWALNSGFTSWREIALRAKEMTPEEQADYLFDLVPTLIEDDMVASWYDASRQAVAAEDFEEAQVLVDLMGTAARATERPWDWALYTAAHADLLDDMGQHEDAIPAYREAVEQAAQFPYVAAIAANNMAAALSGLARYEEAIAAYRQALALREGLPADQQGGSADSWRGIGVCAEQLYRYTEALEAYETALALYRQRTDLTAVERETTTLRDLGDVHAALGQYEQAIARRQEALTRARELGWSGTVAKAMDDIGASLWDLGRYQEALDAKLQAAELYAENDDPRARHHPDQRRQPAVDPGPPRRGPGAL